MGSSKPIDIDLLPADLEFAVFTGEEIKKLSVVKIITGLTFDPLGHPLPGGLYDGLMGTYGKRMETCSTCLQMQSCPGHMGHIELSAVVYNPFFVKLVQRILNIFCLNCFKVQLKDYVLEIVKLQLRLVDAGYIIEAQELELFKSEYVCQSEEQIKLESGDYVHPRVAELNELLQRQGNSQQPHNTKTSCALRTAIVNAALQRSTNKKCLHCKKEIRVVKYAYRKLVYYISAAQLKSSNPDSTVTTGQNKVVFADECRKYLRAISDFYNDFLKLLFPILKTYSKDKGYPVDLFFMDTIPVTPPKARPTNFMNGNILEHPQTGVYRSIVENNAVMRVIMRYLKNQDNDMTDEAKAIYDGIRGTSSYEKLYNAWQALQTSIDLLLDVSISREASASSQGLKQILEKKEGLLRKHMMGKRVNYAARTVITPDPNINVDEVGIPDIFARKLSYPVPVTAWNVAELRKMVMNGPNVHPGANYIQDERGYTTLIPADNAAKRESMAKLLFNYPENGIKIVHRHVLNGDVLLLNRQPSLHKPSIMAHKARILSGEKTFRLHYSNCKAYNADFDGDEMNAHLPQNEVARSEAYNLANVANNYLVPKDGTPLGGLIQDHVISGVKLSIRGRFFNREEYQQLVFQGLAHIKGNIKLLPPTIIKPVMLWSGKQILSTIIMNSIPDDYERINLVSTAKIAEKNWKVTASHIPMAGGKYAAFFMSEASVNIRKGELIIGVLDKQQYGATTYGLIHCVYELYGGEVSTRLLTAFTKVFTVFLQREGFTLGVQDILVTAEADRKRRTIIKECREIGNSVVAAALDLEEELELDALASKMDDAYIKDPSFRVILDRKYKSMLDGYTNDINKTCLPDGLISRFPHNNLQLMVLSGAKGSMVNTMQISCLLGQIELEGKRPPLMISGKSLPSFTAFETSPKSGGFIDGRFMTGIQPQDFFFHCMAGREGLIDTAVKTSRSGYLQRCLIKHLEGLTVNYDLTVRDSDNSVVQFLYGEDGLDILKSKYLNERLCKSFLRHNADVILRPAEQAVIRDEVSISKIARHVRKIRSWQKKFLHKIDNDDHATYSKRMSAFTHFSAELNEEIEIENPNERNPKTGRSRLTESILKLWKKSDSESKELYRKKYARCPDPTATIYKQDCHYGSVSENIENLIDELTKSYPYLRDKIADILYTKNIKSLAAPGEPVGLLAAQSIGEPSTQMTLNTFHFAGRGEMNVTLGIPRLREILMLASSNIKTPSMDIPIKPGQIKYAEKLRVLLNRVTVKDLLQFIHVKISLQLQPDRAYQYQLRFQFLPREAYKNDFCVKPKQIIKYMSTTFFKSLFRLIITTSRKIGMGSIEIEESKTGKNNRGNEDGVDVNEAEDDHEVSQKNKKSSKNYGNGGDNDIDTSDDDNDDDDAMGIKLKSRKQDETEYDDPDDVEEMKDANENDEDLESNADVKLEEQAEEELPDKITDKVMDNDMVVGYEYDKENYLWCKLVFNLPIKYRKTDISSILRNLAAKSVVHSVQDLKRAIIYKDVTDVQLLKTDGINIIEMFKYDKILNLNKIYSNDIHAIARTYGIEAAAQVIVKEVTNVFKVYGITVDRRHLSLVADYMTFDGTFQPLSRKGMEHSPSPLQQMSFESCMQFLKNATGSGRKDDLNSPSSRLMVGLPVKNGTGAFDLLTQLC